MVAPVSSENYTSRKFGSDNCVGFLKDHWEEYTILNQV